MTREHDMNRRLLIYRGAVSLKESIHCIPSRGFRAYRLLVGFVCQYPVPNVVSVFLTFQAAKQGSKLCLIDESMMQCDGNIHLVKGVLNCTHQRASLHMHIP